MTILEKYWAGVASRLQVEADTFSRLITHNGERGRSNELALADLVQRLLPLDVGVGTGLVFDSRGKQSKQMDLVVYSRASQPQFLNQTSQFLFPIETVVAVIEVKTTVTEAETADTAAKFESIRDLTPAEGYSHPTTALFGYTCSGAVKSRLDEIIDIPENSRPEIVCILHPGIASPAGANSKPGLIPLHNTDASGLRIAGDWRVASSNSSVEVIDGRSYPVSRLKSRGKPYVFEPGRALLLFADALSSEICQRLGQPQSWLSRYLPDEARETVI
ncbi:DUF6602 domain-containing protein [Galactobacter valiniphilus]|uniref:DUF6602 domain-containing protein n=1 Tax=Galactobacter valiniphilus TaxID=2676122 RepID=UPI0037366FC4